jgi:hypothetical protein
MRSIITLKRNGEYPDVGMSGRWVSHASRARLLREAREASRNHKTAVRVEMWTDSDFYTTKKPETVFIGEA